MNERAAEKHAGKASQKIAGPAPTRGQQQHRHQNAVGKPENVEAGAIDGEVVGTEDGERQKQDEQKRAKQKICGWNSTHWSCGAQNHLPPGAVCQLPVRARGSVEVATCSEPSRKLSAGTWGRFALSGNYSRGCSVYQSIPGELSGDRWSLLDFPCWMHFCRRKCMPIRGEQSCFAALFCRYKEQA